MGLPGNGTVPVVFSERLRLAKKAGMQILEVLKADLRPSDIMTKKAFENAVAVDMALGGYRALWWRAARQDRARASPGWSTRRGRPGHAAARPVIECAPWPRSER